MYVNNCIFHIIKPLQKIETLPTEPPRIKYGKPSKFFPLFINICVHLLPSCHASTHKLFLSKDMPEKKFYPFFSPEGSDFLAFPEDLSIHYRLPEDSPPLPFCCQSFFLGFQEFSYFLLNQFAEPKCIHAAFQPDCVAIDCSGQLLMVSVVTRAFLFLIMFQ